MGFLRHDERRYSNQQQVYSDLKLISINALQIFDKVCAYSAFHSPVAHLLYLTNSDGYWSVLLDLLVEMR